MPRDTNDLAARITALARDLHDVPPEQMEIICERASDMLSDINHEDPAHGLIDESLIDGLRAGHRAAWVCERHGGALVWLRLPEGRFARTSFPIAAASIDPEQALRAVELALRGVEINLAKLTERVGHLPSKGFIVGATMGGVAFITGIMIFLERIWDFVGPAAGN